MSRIVRGIAFAFAYGFSILQKDKVQPKVIRTGNDNMFQSEIFSTTIATLLGIDIEIYDNILLGPRQHTRSRQRT